MAASLLEEIGYNTEKELEDGRKNPEFSTPKTLTSYTRGALNKELIKTGIIEREELTTDGGRLTLTGLNKLYFLLTGETEVFKVRRNFFRAILSDDVDMEVGFCDNDVGSSDQFTREGLAKVVKEFCDPS